MNEPARDSEPPEEPYLFSQPTILSPASPKPMQFPQPTNIPVLENMMDVGFNQTEFHMNDPATRNTELRPDAWRDPGEQQQNNDDHEHTAAATAASNAAEMAHDGHSTQGELAQKAFDAHSTEPAANGYYAQPVSLSNSLSYEANSHTNATVAAPETSVDVRLSSSNGTVSAPDAADFVQAQLNEVKLDQSQQPTPVPGAVDVQALLDTLQTSIAPTTEATFTPSADGTLAATSLSPSHVRSQPPFPGSDVLSPLSASGLGAPPNGLPPRPPPQDQPIINPNYVHSQHIRDYHPHAANSAVQTHARGNSAGNAGNADPNAQPSHATNAQQSALPAGFAYQNGQPQTSPVTAQHNSQGQFGQQQQYTASAAPIESRREYKIAAGEIPTMDDQPWTADIQRKYDHFMEEERRYVNEARWDQFPQGSRLFVGNLSSEKVTKRDIFHVFHTYGELAQISIKQAYGFVQFIRTDDCTRALAAEQGRQIRDKRIHLEISKPQKSNNKQQQTQSQRPRSRSPEYGSRGRQGNNVDRYVSGSRNGGGRGRDGYRGGYRSPSPRDYRDRYEERYRTRSRSPGYGRGYRAPSPRRDIEDELPLPRRQPRDVPDVQIIALDQLDRDFMTWVEKAFTARSVRVDVLILSPRLSEEAVVRRQIMEGVLAVSKLTRTNQNSGKIGLTIFRRTQGTSDVNFEDYDNLDPNICVELVLREKQTQGNVYANHQYGGQQAPQPQAPYVYPPQQPQQQPPYTPSEFPPGYGQPPSSYGAPQHGQPHPGAGAPAMNVDSNNLQNLLSTLNQPPSQTPHTTGSYGTQAGYPPQQNQSYPPQQDPYAAYRNNPAYAGMIPGGQQGGAPRTQLPAAASPSGQAPPNMQDILARLGTYRQ